MSDSEDYEEDKVIEDIDEDTNEDTDEEDKVIEDTDEEDKVIEDTDEDIDEDKETTDTDEVIEDSEEDVDTKVFKTSILSNEEFNNFYKNYDISKNKTSNILTKYEKAKVLSDRTEQLSSGAVSLINKKLTNTLEIAEEELEQNKIPFIIKRLINNNYEYWKLEDLIKL